MAYVPGFADLINRALARLDRSPSWLAQRIDVNPSTVSRWLNQGARPGDPEIVVRVADVLGLTGQVHELLVAAGYGYVEMAGQDSTDAASVTATIPPALLPTASPANHTNLPAAVTPFLGRERELTELTRLLADPKLRLLSIIGPGGMGKTRLAVECARREMEQYPDGVCFVPLAPLQVVDDLLPAIAAALGYAFLTDARTPQQQLFDYLREKALLLVLDNFEHLIDGAGLVHELLQAAPRLKVLVTSRERLRLSGETVFLLDGMDFPDWETPSDLNTYSAVSLFLQSARFARPDFTLQSDDLSYVVRLCRLVDGTPLGIVLAAAWVEVLNLAEITAEIERSLDFLASDLRDLPERQRSLRAVFDHSWRLLGDNERAVFQAMSIFRGGFTRKAAEEVAGAGLTLLTALLNKSLLHRTATGRYELHELVRQYAAEKLSQEPTAAMTRDRHTRHYLVFVQRQMDDLTGSQVQIRLAEVDDDLGNIRAAWGWAIKQGEAALVGSSLDGLCRYYEWQGRYGDGEAASHSAADLASTTKETLAEINALIWQASFCRTLGDQEQAESLLQRSASALEQVSLAKADVRREQAALFLGFARLARDAGNGPTAKQRYAESVAIYESLDDGLAITRVLGEMSYVLRSLMIVDASANQEPFVEAEQVARRSVSISRQFDYPIGVAEGLLQLTAVLNMQGRAEEAHQASKESLALYTELGIESGIVEAQCLLGFLMLYRRNYAEARFLNSLALESAQRNGNLQMIGRTHVHLGLIDLCEEAYVNAQQSLNNAITASRTAGMRGDLALGTCFLGYAERGLGNPIEATKRVAETLRLGINIRFWWPLRSGILLWALLLAEQGNMTRALELYWTHAQTHVRDWRIDEDTVRRHFRAGTAHVSAEVVAAAQNRGQARDLLSSAQEILDEIDGGAKE